MVSYEYVALQASPLVLYSPPGVRSALQKKFKSLESASSEASCPWALRIFSNYTSQLYLLL